MSSATCCSYNHPKSPLAFLARCGAALLAASTMLLPISGYAAPSDTSVRSAVEGLLDQRWHQIATISGPSGGVSPGSQTRSDEIRATVHLTGLANGEATERQDGLWEAPVTYQVEFVTGGRLSRYGSTATAVLWQNDALAWTAIQLEHVHTKGSIVGDR
jgi:DNA-binding LacI/PurR family transcriptional regulator